MFHLRRPGVSPADCMLQYQLDRGFTRQSNGRAKVTLHVLLVGMDSVSGSCCQARAVLPIFLHVCLCCGALVFMHTVRLPRAVPMVCALRPSPDVRNRDAD